MRPSIAGVAVQAASVLLAGRRFEEALGRAEEALGLLSPDDSRLEMLARSIATECLIELGRPAQALRSFLAARALYDAPWGRPVRLKVDYLKARLLDAFGHVRESKRPCARSSPVTSKRGGTRTRSSTR